LGCWQTKAYVPKTTKLGGKDTKINKKERGEYKRSIGEKERKEPFTEKLALIWGRRPECWPLGGSRMQSTGLITVERGEVSTRRRAEATANVWEVTAACAN